MARLSVGEVERWHARLRRSGTGDAGIDPELKERLTRRAEAAGIPVSEVIREALRLHLEAS